MTSKLYWPWIKNLNPVKKFALTSLGCILILVLTFSLLISHFLTRTMLAREGEVTTDFIRAMVGKFLTPEDFQEPLTSNQDRKFQEFFKEIRQIPELVRIKVFSPTGTIFWSDEPALIGKSFPGNRELKEAVLDKIQVQLEFPGDSYHVNERKFGWLTEIYVPILSPHGNRVIAVIETYKQPSRLLAILGSARKLVWLIALLGGLFLYLCLYKAFKSSYERQKELEQQIVEVERLASKGQLAAEIGHEINNYLTVLNGNLEVLSGELDGHRPPNTEKRMRTIQEYLDKMTRFTNGLQDLSHLGTRPSPCQLNDLLTSLVGFVKPQNRFDNINIVIESSPELPRIEVDEVQMQQIFLNLLLNAAESIRDSGKKSGTIRITTQFDTSRDSIVISVQDTGCGIEPDCLERIFEPRYTTKKDGHGFGLVACQTIVTNHQGSIQVASNPGKGSTFTVLLPRKEPAAKKARLFIDSTEQSC